MISGGRVLVPELCQSDGHLHRQILDLKSTESNRAWPNRFLTLSPNNTHTKTLMCNGLQHITFSQPPPSAPPPGLPAILANAAPYWVGRIPAPGIEQDSWRSSTGGLTFQPGEYEYSPVISKQPASNSQGPIVQKHIAVYSGERKSRKTRNPWKWASEIGIVRQKAGDGNILFCVTQPICFARFRPHQVPEVLVSLTAAPCCD